MENNGKGLTSSSKREDASEERPTKQEDEHGQSPSDESGRGTGSTEKSSLATPQSSGSTSETEMKGSIPGLHIDSTSSDAQSSPPRISPTKVKRSPKRSPIGKVMDCVRKSLSPKRSDVGDKDSTAAKSPGRSPSKARSPKKTPPKPKSPKMDYPLLKGMLSKSISPSSKLKETDITERTPLLANESRKSSSENESQTKASGSRQCSLKEVHERSPKKSPKRSPKKKYGGYERMDVQDEDETCTEDKRTLNLQDLKLLNQGGSAVPFSRQVSAVGPDWGLVNPPPEGAEGSVPMTPDGAYAFLPSDLDLDSVKPFVGASAAADATVPPPVARRFSEDEREVTSRISKSLELGGVGKSDRGSEEASGSGVSHARLAKVKRHQFDSQETKEVPDAEPSPKKQPKRETDESESDPNDE